MGHGFHITLGVSPTGRLDLSTEIELAKAAILYADTTELYSITAGVLQAAQRLDNLSASQKFDQFRMVLPYMPPSDSKTAVLKFMKREKRFRHHPEFVAVLEEGWQGIRDCVADMAEKSRLSDLEPAVRAGVLEVHPLGPLASTRGAMEYLADCMALRVPSPAAKLRRSSMEAREQVILTEFFSGVTEAIGDGRTYPIFDSATSDLVRAAIRAGVVEAGDQAVVRGRHSALAAHLLERLPLFDCAGVDEVLDIRRELSGPLVRFRSAMLKFSQHARTAAWDEDFTSEAELVYHADVAPAVLEIREEIRSNKLLKSLVSEFAREKLEIPAGAAVLTLILGKVSALPSEFVAALGLSAAVARLVYRTYEEWRKKQTEIESSSLYFYYGTGQRIASRR